jgi:hypothetical protein
MLELGDTDTFCGPNHNHNPHKNRVQKARKCPKLSLTEAAIRLFDPHMGYNVDLRNAYAYPPGYYREDVHLQFDFALERGKGNPRRELLANGVLGVLHDKLAPNFTANKSQALLHLNIYIVDVSEGDREARIISSETTECLVRLCVAWIVCVPDGSLVLEGGRVGDTDMNGYGFLDALHLRSGEQCLYDSLARKVAKNILNKLSDLPSKEPWYTSFTS